MGDQKKLRIATEYIRDGFFQTTTHEERTIIPEDIWQMPEEDAKGNINPKINTRRGNSRLNKYFSPRKEQSDAIAENIWEWEVGHVIDQLNRRNAVGAENITSEILRRIGNWIASLLTDIINDGEYNNEMNNEWLPGIVTLLRKNKDPPNIDNYRPTALLNIT